MAYFAYVAKTGFVPGSIYVFAGISGTRESITLDGNWTFNRRTMEFDVVDEVWVEKAEMPEGEMFLEDDEDKGVYARQHFGFGQLYEGQDAKGYLLGGGLRWDWRNNIDSPLKGPDSGDDHGWILNTTEYSPGLNAFAGKANMISAARARMATASFPATATGGGHFFAFGGVGSTGNALNRLDEFTDDPSPGGAWIARSTAWTGNADGRFDAAGAAADGDAYFICGAKSAASPDPNTDADLVNTVLKWDGSSWSTETAFPGGGGSPGRHESTSGNKAQAQCAVVDDDIYMISGRDLINTSGTTFYVEFHKYDPSTDAWSTIASGLNLGLDDWPSVLRIRPPGGDPFSQTRGVFTASGGELHWVGGRSQGRTMRNSHGVYDPVAEAWRTLDGIFQGGSPFKWSQGNGGAIG